MTRRLATLLLLAIAAPAAAQWFDWQTPGLPRTADGSVDVSAPAPRTPEGRPEFSGMWVPTSFTGSILDPQNIQQWALDELEKNAGNFFADDPRFHCLPSGPGVYPAGAAYGGMRRIVQEDDYIAVLYGDMTYRQIFLDGRELEDTVFPTWTGFSSAHWDGDTLVVESNGYNDKTWLHRDGLPHTEALHITERYTRDRFGHLLLELTWDDPGTFHRPVSGVVELRFVADSDLLEVVCNESSMGTSHYTGTAEEAEEKVVEVDEQTLEKYVGTYEGVWLGNLITVDITREGNELFIERTPPYAETGIAHAGRTPLTAQSENAFECCGLGFIFTNEQDGVTTEVLEVHVSGAWSFARVE